MKTNDHLERPLLDKQAVMERIEEQLENTINDLIRTKTFIS